MAKWGMVIDLEKCVGCQACSVACGMENTRIPGEHWQDVVFFQEGDYPNAELKWFPRPCMHCENPSCVAVCPVRATYKAEDGQVLVDWERCIGCHYCMIACPYGVRFFENQPPTYGGPDIMDVYPSESGHNLIGEEGRNWNPPWRLPDHLEDWKHGVGVSPRNVVTKCNFCYHRVSKAPKGVADLDPQNPVTREYTPACVVTCAPGARFFGDLANPNSEVNKLIASKNGVRLLDHFGNKPQVYYLTGEGGAVPSNRAVNKI